MRILLVLLIESLLPLPPLCSIFNSTFSSIALIRLATLFRSPPRRLPASLHIFLSYNKGQDRWVVACKKGKHQNVPRDRQIPQATFSSKRRRTPLPLFSLCRLSISDQDADPCSNLPCSLRRPVGNCHCIGNCSSLPATIPPRGSRVNGLSRKRIRYRRRGGSVVGEEPSTSIKQELMNTYSWIDECVRAHLFNLKHS